MATSVIPVPTLSTQGWVSDPVSKFDFLLAHFFVSDYNQTFLYKDHVTSLPRIIEKHGSDMVSVIDSLKTLLSSYLAKYYDSVDVDVQPTIPLDINPSSQIALTVKVGVSDKGTANVFGRLLQGQNAKIDKILKLNNGD